MLLTMSVFWQMGSHSTACPNSPELRPSPGLRNGTHAVMTGFPPYRLFWYESRLKQMFPVKLWIAPQRAHQRPQSPQATHRTKGLHETDFFFTEWLQLLGLLALNNLILYPSHKWNMTHSFIKGRHYSVNGLGSQLEEIQSLTCGCYDQLTLLA